MDIATSTISLNVDDPAASADFLVTHCGYRVSIQSAGFVAVAHDGGGVAICFLQVGLPTFKPSHRAGVAGDGLLLAFTVDDLDAKCAAMQANGARLVTPPETEPWGERYCQFDDPNGIIVQLVQWV